MGRINKLFQAIRRKIICFFYQPVTDGIAIMPLWDYVILEQDLDYVSKIIRPDTADPKKIEGLELKVITIGPDCNNIKVGDRLIFNPAAAVTFAYESKQYWLISERATGVVIAKERKIGKNPADRMPA